MIFTPRNKKVNDVNLYINKVSIGKVYVTKFLGVPNDSSQLNWKNHIEYTCKKLSKCIGILSDARRKLQFVFNPYTIPLLSNISFIVFIRLIYMFHMEGLTLDETAWNTGSNYVELNSQM